jgi:hypothetical protein
METLTKSPIYVSHEIPENVGVSHVHEDFKLSTKYLIDMGVIQDEIEKSKNYLYYWNKYKKEIILEDELRKLMHFWGLMATSTEHYIGDIPYKNQLDIYKFFELDLDEKDKTVNPKDCIVIATRDLVANFDQIRQECWQKQEELRKLHQSYSLRIGRLEVEKRMKQWLVEDPIILYPVETNIVTKLYQENKGYLMITAWGEEAEMLKSKKHVQESV